MGGRGGRGRDGLDGRRVALVVIAIALLVIIVLVISSCVRGCSQAATDSAEQAATTEVNAQDSRVAAGVDETTTAELTTALDRGDQLSWIAANAGLYPTSMIDLAVDEPAAVSFVRDWPDSDKTASAYTDAVTKGTVPQLMMFDTRWGNLDYAGSPLGVKGSGPTCVAMGYMGLTGANDKTPGDVSVRVTDAGMATGDGGMDGSFIAQKAGDLGLTGVAVSVDATSISTALKAGQVVICEVKADTLTTVDHFVVLAKENDNTTLTVYDPTSTEVSSHEWSYSTIVSSASGAWGLSASTTAATTAATE
ncbi:MAG: hypothetical protein PHR15_00090 [Atopobiaceae bacterium]|jgi:hypothetical protein|nr:hypothetical protein [Atopobiaceae bacterium]MCH4214291.1 hypothetical protein [Atopobiaceae bacterium]MCH4229412.1 hypothetical protein [Atopobiaceae bacterium]MCI1226857.1 hypothetical protein [Atopobiaceae bacterium]MCI1260189.1 hypothetical protein [Atopobiaceae bacterium]